MKINGERHYLWRAVDRKVALRFIRKSMKRNGQPKIIVADKLRSYRSAMMIIGNADQQETGR